MDKIQFRKIMESEKLPIPNYVVVKKGHKKLDLKSLGKYPYFVKPYNQGSSVGASIATNKKDLIKSLDNGFKYSDGLIIDEFIEGREYTCPVLGNEVPKSLPVIEIIPRKGKFFDYDSKYSDNGSDEIVPAKISSKLTKAIQELAVEVYTSIGCRGFGRIDFIVDSDDNPYILEINTIPGLTPMSLFPKSAKSIGLTYKALLDKIIKLSLEK
jgi:D-alanine-D-alanine ligase